MNDVLSHQAEFIQSNYRHTGLVGGFRSGKSHAGVIKTTLKKLAMPGIDVAYYLPTYSLIKDVAFPKFSEFLDLNNIDYTLNKSDKDIITPYGRIILRSMDSPEYIIGYEVGYSLIDEADIPSKSKMGDIMRKVLARNSVKIEGNNNATDFVSTPEGFKFLYDFFVKEPNPNKHLIKASTRNNPFISDDYIQSLEETYSKEQLSAYLEGEFVNLTSGTVYHAFDRERNHSDREVKPNDRLHIGMDFNITNMSATIRVTDGRISTAVDEVTGAYDTASMIQILKERYPKHHMTIYPDASGNARNTAGDSDIKLLKKARLLVRVGSKNPSVRDRITTVNGSFMNSKGETTNYVNTNNCPELTEAYERLAYKKGVPDKESGFDHICDADNYCVFNLKNKGTSKMSAG